MDRRLELTVENGGSRKVMFEVRTLVNAGRTGRDPTEVKKHLDELARAGIKVSQEIPIYHPKIRDRITTEEVIEVLPNSKSCGEVEPVLVFNHSEVYVSVGSDHTDREFEKTNIRVSKQLCLNVMAPRCWRYEDVIDHWDELVMRAWAEKDGKRTLYQEDTLDKLLRPEALIEGAKARLGANLDGLLLFGGTFPILGGEFVFSPRFEMELFDPRRRRSIRHAYAVTPIAWCK